MKLKNFFLMALFMCSLPSFASRSALTQWTILTGAYSYINDKVVTNIKLKNDAVMDIALDNSGNVYMACNRFGLIKWDGKTLTEFQAPKSSLIANADITAMECDSKNNFYIGTNRGICVFNGKDWTDYTQDITGISVVRNIAITQMDKVYISGYAIENKEVITTSLLAFFNGSNWSKADAVYFPDRYFSNLTIDQNNFLWVTLGESNEKGLAKYDGKNWKLYNSGNGVPVNEIGAIGKNNKGNLVFTTAQGIMEYADGKFTMSNYSNSFGKKLNEILMRNNNELRSSVISMDATNSYWISSREGIMTLSENGFRIFNGQNSPVNSYWIRKILVDKNNTKWFTGGGNGVMGVKEFNLPTKNVSMINSTLVNVDMSESFSFLKDKTGQVWATSANSGLLKLKGNASPELFQHEKGSLSSMFIKGCTAADGKMYLTVNGGGIKVFDNGSIADYAKSPTFGGATDVAVDGDNVVWAASSGGLSKFVNGAWETYNKGNGGLPSIIVYCVFKDSKNQIWAGTGKGLVKYEGNNTFKVFTKKEVPFPSDDITAIGESKDGKIWFGSKRGISVYDGTNWIHYEKLESLDIKNFYVTGIDFDKNGNAWIATYRDGVLKFDGTNWTQISKDNSKNIYDNVTAICVSADNKLYIASSFNDFMDKPMYMEMNNEDKIFSGINKRIIEGEPKHLITIIDLNN
ncbi:MAG: hypothetical protein RL065_886 [Bacteroidota bacterium]|jgi:ligand-binding sensor domain-containing protein